MNTVVELFGGCGGLTLGLQRAGFKSRSWIERDATCVATAGRNESLLGLARTPTASDATEVDWSPFAHRVDLLAGGVPCQPFSFGGRSLGRADSRDAFPQLIRALQVIQPRAVLVENVKGFVSETFDAYFTYVLQQIEMPEITRHRGESWRSHRIRLDRARPAYARSGSLSYVVNWHVFQAADYGLGQLRERLFIVGYRSDLGISWTPPHSTHSRDRLLHDMFVSQQYWNAFDLEPRSPRRAQKSLVRALSGDQPAQQPWRTVRQVISDMGRPAADDDKVTRHFFRCGATSYDGHEGSRLDWPAKTIKAGVHGVPGGENMVRLDGGRIRYFTLREAARLQGFPDDFRFEGSWTDAYHQIGNAVPVRLAEIVGRAVAKQLASARRQLPESTRVGAAS